MDESETEYEVEIYELHVQKVLVSAKTKGEALASVLQGDYTTVENGLDFVEPSDHALIDDLEEEHPGLIAEMNDFGYTIAAGDGVCIRSIEEV